MSEKTLQSVLKNQKPSFVFRKSIIISDIIVANRQEVINRKVSDFKEARDYILNYCSVSKLFIFTMIVKAWLIVNLCRYIFFFFICTLPCLLGKGRGVVTCCLPHDLAFRVILVTE